MKIILTEVEITESIREFIKKTMTIPENKEFVIDVSSSRGVGVTAEISIENKDFACETKEVVVEEAKPETNEQPLSTNETIKEITKKKSFFADLE